MGALLVVCCLFGASCSSTSSTELGLSDMKVSVPSNLSEAELFPVCDQGQPSRLKIVSIFPEGEALGAPARRVAAEIAIEEVDEGGGVFDESIEHVSLSLPEGASDESFDELIKTDAEDAIVLLTAVGSENGLRVLHRIVDDAGPIQISPNQTAVILQDSANSRWYFRTTASDFVQANVLSGQLYAEDMDDVVVLYRNDAYGISLQGALRSNFEFGTKRVRSIQFEDAKSDFSGLVDSFMGGDGQPDALVIIGYDEETAEILRALKRYEPASRPSLWGVDGNVNVRAKLEPPEHELLAGFRQAVPWPSNPNTPSVRDLHQQIKLRTGDDDAPLSFTAETYDAVVIVALAAIAAECDTPSLVAQHINDVTRSGIKCFTFVTCQAMLKDGQDIDYDGLSSAHEFREQGESSVGGFRVDTYGENGQVVSSQFKTQKYCEICRANASSIYFDSGSAALSIEVKRRLADVEVVDLIKEQLSLGGVEIQGFASPDGSFETNCRLSKARAEAVHDYLVSDHGIDGTHLTTVGFGETEQMPQDRVVLFAEPNPDDRGCAS